MFLLAEIDALEQIFKKEEEKIAEAKLKREIKTAIIRRQSTSRK